MGSVDDGYGWFSDWLAWVGGMAAMSTHCTHSECRSLHNPPLLAASLSALHNEVRFSFRLPPSPPATMPLCLFCAIVSLLLPWQDHKAILLITAANSSPYLSYITNVSHYPHPKPLQPPPYRPSHPQIPTQTTLITTIIIITPNPEPLSPTCASTRTTTTSAAASPTPLSVIAANTQTYNSRVMRLITGIRIP